MHRMNMITNLVHAKRISIYKKNRIYYMIQGSTIRKGWFSCETQTIYIKGTDR